MHDRLLDDYQRDFPLVARPFAVIGEQLATSEDAVLSALRTWIAQGTVSRVGAVLRPGSFGASTLAALAVPPARLREVAALVSACPEVNHNYEREHRFNLWFVVTASDAARVAQVLASIERRTGLAAISLPLEAEYHVDLGFALAGPRRGGTVDDEARCDEASPIVLDPSERDLLAVLQNGLPLVPRPFAALAEAAGWRGTDGERAVIARIGAWIERGAIRRFGVIVRHRALGFVANAMCAWDVPLREADRLGCAIAREPAITLCYRRRRAAPAWPYNLFCMIHGRDRGVVQRELADVSARHGLGAYRGAVLFSRRAFKQRGARYVEPAGAAHG